MNIFRLWATILPTSLSVSRIILFGIISIVIGLGSSAIAQAETSITQTTGVGDLGTHVLPPIGHVYGITGGTPVGTNLYHSFAQFNVGTGDIAQFQTPALIPDAAMHNILGRITDANPSIIFGTIDSVTYYPNANLFLMNPYGFLFGPTAMVNVGGMAAFTTADYLRLTDSVRFEAIPGAQDALLGAFPVAAFGFLGSNPAAIAVLGSQLTVANGTSLSLIGGNQGFTYTNPDTGLPALTPDGMMMSGGKLSAPGGQINLVSVASAGEVLNGTLEPAPNTNGISFTAMGNISLSQQATLNVSDDAAGTVRIRGGQFVIADATLLADTGNANGASTAIDIHVTGDLSITDTRGIPAMTARTTGTGDAGAIQVTTGNLTATSNFIDPSFLPTAVIDSHTSGDGRSGDVHITTGNLAVSGTITNSFLFIDSGTAANGRGGDVMITAEKVDFKSASISTGQLSASATVIDTLSVNGSAGNLTITADTLQLNNSNMDTTALLGLSDLQKGGEITIQGHNISLTNTQVTSSGIESGGSIKITAERIVTDFATMETDTIFEQGGSITIQAHDLALTNGSSLISTTFGDGNAGNILVSATDHIKIIGDAGTNPLAVFRPSGIFSNSFGDFGSSGSAGNVIVTTPSLEMVGGRINTVTASSGQGGNVTLDIAGSLSISGEFPSSRLIIPSVFDIGPLAPSGIVTSTVGSEFCTGPCGKAGDVSINTGSLSMGDGSQINSGTNSTGNGGLITINAKDTISMSGRISDGSPVGVFSRTIGSASDSGSGGNIGLTAGQSVTISNGASVSASSTGAGDAGNVTIQGLASPAQSVLIDGAGSGIFTDTQGTGAGGNIFVNADLVTLQNRGALSAITSGTQATATGGTITVHANQVQLNDQATITATSTRLFDKPNSGAGNAGTITVTAEETIVLRGNSSITSSAEAEGNGGLVSLTAPSIELHGHSNIGTSTAGLGNAGTIELQGNQVNLLTDSFVTARTQAEGHGGNITIRGLTGEGSLATDVRLSDKSQVRSQTVGDGEHVQGAAGNILVETARLNLSGGSLLTTGSLGSTGAAGNITVNATDSLTISGVGTQLNSESVDFSFGDAGHISISAPSVVIENSGQITTSTGLVGNAGTITINTNNLQLLSGGHITSSSLAEFPELSSGAAGTVTIQGLASSAQSILIDGPASGIFTDTLGTGLGGNITLNANTVALQNSSTLSAKTSGTAPSATGGTITIDAADTISMSNRASINASSRGGADAGSINITAMNGFTMQNSTITTQAGQGAGGGNIKVTTSPSATVLLENSRVSASVADGSGGGGNISIDPQYVILQNSQILAQAAQGQGGAITIIANLFLSDANSIVNADSGSGVNGTITIQSPNAPISGQIQPLGKTPLIATTLLNQHCAALAGGKFSSFTVAGRDSLPIEPGSWLASPLYAAGAGTGEGLSGLSGLSSLSGVSGVVRGGLAAHQIDQTDQSLLSLRKIAPAGFLTQAFAVEGSTGCES